MRIERFPDHTLKKFLMRTVAAQSHLLGCIAAIVGLIVLCRVTLSLENASHFWACLAFAVPSVLVFGTSATYHFISDGYVASPRLSQFLENLDHFAIYLLIAGTYTPFLVNTLKGVWLSVLLSLIWGLAILGILYTGLKSFLPKWMRHRFFHTGLFVMMGWTIILRIGEVLKNMSSGTAHLLIAGGASYTLGAVVYAFKRPRLFVGVFGFHELWHVMVMIGFGFHYFMVLSFYQ